MGGGGGERKKETHTCIYCKQVLYRDSSTKNTRLVCYTTNSSGEGGGGGGVMHDIAEA